MWLIRFYSGPLAGKQLPLKAGRNVVGRAPHCDVIIPSQSVSKEHLIIEIYEDKIILSDSGSRNGTFVNGLQIKSHRLQKGERIEINDVVADIVLKSSSPSAKKERKKSTIPAAHSTPSAPVSHLPVLTGAPPAAYQGGAAYELAQMPIDEKNPETPLAPDRNFIVHLKKYVDDVVLPGIYKLAEWFEFRIVIGIFVAAFIVIVVCLSTVPLVRILKDSIQKESQNRARTIARTLAQVNRSALMEGITSSVSVEIATKEPGVDKAYIISNINGDIIAPSELAGQYIADIPFVNSARKEGQESVAQINDSTIAALVPIKYYNAATNTETTTAHAVVIYDMGTLAIDNHKTLSLFVQILFIALIVGGILYFFLFKIMEYPIVNLNEQLNIALRDGAAQISTTFIFPELQLLASNINTIISRKSGGFAGENIQKYEPDRTSEIQGLIGLFGYAAMAINATDRMILACNEPFISQISLNANWVSQSIISVNDQALKLNLQALLEKVAAQPSTLALDQLEINGTNYQISAQGILGSQNLAYVLIVFTPLQGAS